MYSVAVLLGLYYTMQYVLLHMLLVDRMGARVLLGGLDARQPRLYCWKELGIDF